MRFEGMGVPDTIEFYNTLYRQQDYSRRILVHKIPLVIQFEGFRAAWTILTGESKMITPPKK